MYLERTPNEIINKVVADTVLDKPSPSMALVQDALLNLPLQKSKFKMIAGAGDYGKSRSTLGSAVLNYNEVVAKISLGKPAFDANSRISQMKKSEAWFRDFSPDTMIIVSATEDKVPKPVVIQKTVDGKPVCNTPINQLFRLKTLYQIKNLVIRMREWRMNNEDYDLCGQKTAKNILGRALQLVPFFSDNMMIDKSGKVYLTDNIIETVRDKSEIKVNPIKKIIPKQLLYSIPIMIINCSIMAKKIHNLLTLNYEVLELNTVR